MIPFELERKQYHQSCYTPEWAYKDSIFIETSHSANPRNYEESWENSIRKMAIEMVAQVTRDIKKIKNMHKFNYSHRYQYGDFYDSAQWVLSTDKSLFTYEWCCNYLGLRKEKLREMVKEIEDVV